MEGTSANRMTKKSFSGIKNNSRFTKKRKFSFNKSSKSQSNNRDDFKRKSVTGANSFKSRKVYSQKNSDEVIDSFIPLKAVKSSKKLKFISQTDISEANMKNVPKQMKNKAKKAKKRRLSSSGLENTSETPHVTSHSKSKKAKKNFKKTFEHGLDENEEFSELCFSSEGESNEDNLRDEIQNSSLFQKIQKLRTKSPHLNLSLKKSKTASGSAQNIGDPSSEYITDDSSDVMSEDSIDEDSSLEDTKEDSKISESNINFFSKDDLKISSQKQSIGIKNYNQNINSVMLLKAETSSKNSFERSKKSSTSTNLKNKVREKLAAAKFRFLNEKLYTETGKEAFLYFKENNDEFEDYHLGYRQQVSKWPTNPVNEIISDLQEFKKNVVIADLGCGDAKIAQVFPNKTVHSFDLVPLNEYVKACDISKVPLPNESVDVAVFCLSLMGINLKDYLCEAFRILKVGGILKIAEVESRIEDLEHFISYLKSIGFALEKKNTKHKMFVFLDLKKEKKNCKRGKLSNFSLRPCLYKKR